MRKGRDRGTKWDCCEGREKERESGGGGTGLGLQRKGIGLRKGAPKRDGTEKGAQLRKRARLKGWGDGGEEENGTEGGGGVTENKEENETEERVGLGSVC